MSLSDYEPPARVMWPKRKPLVQLLAPLCCAKPVPGTPSRSEWAQAVRRYRKEQYE